MIALRRIIPLVALVAVLAIAPATMAATPLQQGYQPNDRNAQNDAGNGVGGVKSRNNANDNANDNANGNTGANTVKATKAGSLPFTGFDLGMVFVVGSSLVLLGFGLRRATRRGNQIL